MALALLDIHIFLKQDTKAQVIKEKCVKCENDTSVLKLAFLKAQLGK